MTSERKLLFDIAWHLKGAVGWTSYAIQARKLADDLTKMLDESYMTIVPRKERMKRSLDAHYKKKALSESPKEEEQS